MATDNHLDFFEKIENIKDVHELEILTYDLYGYLLSAKLTPGQACKLFINAIKNKKFNEYYRLWREDNSHSRTEFSFLRLHLQIAGMGFKYISSDLKVEHKKTLSSGIYYHCLDVGVDISEFCFECLSILTKPESSHRFHDINGIDDIPEFFRVTQKCGSAYSRIIFLNIAQRITLSETLKRLKRQMDIGQLKIPFTFQKIFSNTLKVEGSIISAQKVLDVDELSKLGSIFIEESLIRTMFLMVTSGVQHAKEKYATTGEFLEYLDSMLLKKINEIGKTEWLKIDEIKSHLGLYSKTGFPDDYFSYGDKVLLITIKWLSIVENLKSSINNLWAIRTFLRESFQWFTSIESVINKYNNEAAENLKRLLEEETNQIEWKSSLLTSIESKMPNGQFKKLNIQKISETIISMINTEGGNIIIGFIENHNKTLKEYSEDIFDKGKFKFYNISKELEANNYSLDKLNRELEDVIRGDLQIEITEFCEYFSINKIYIDIGDEEEKFLLNITVKKGRKKFFSRGDNKSILLRKRMGSRNEFSDPLIDISIEDIPL